MGDAKKEKTEWESEYMGMFAPSRIDTKPLEKEIRDQLRDQLQPFIGKPVSIKEIQAEILKVLFEGIARRNNALASWPAPATAPPEPYDSLDAGFRTSTEEWKQSVRDRFAMRTGEALARGSE